MDVSELGNEGGKGRGGCWWWWWWGGVWGHRAPSCCINLQIFSDDAKTVTLPPVPSASSSPHPSSLSCFSPMPRSCRMGDSITQQVKTLLSSFSSSFSLYFSFHSFTHSLHSFTTFLISHCGVLICVSSHICYVV